MRPSCYLLESSGDRASLYLGEVSTEECLLVFSPMDPVAISEFGANSADGGWVAASDLPAIKSVAELTKFLRDRPDLDLVDLTATIGHVKLSTHDDGEAQLTFPDEAQAVGFLRNALDSAMAEDVITCLLRNKNHYVAVRGGNPRTFDTFEAYLADRAQD